MGLNNDARSSVDEDSGDKSRARGKLTYQRHSLPGTLGFFMLKLIFRINDEW